MTNDNSMNKRARSLISPKYTTPATAISQWMHILEYYLVKQIANIALHTSPNCILMKVCPPKHS